MKIFTNITLNAASLFIKRVVLYYVYFCIIYKMKLCLTVIKYVLVNRNLDIKWTIYCMFLLWNLTPLSLDFFDLDDEEVFSNCRAILEGSLERTWIFLLRYSSSFPSFFLNTSWKSMKDASKFQLNWLIDHFLITNWS